MMCGCMSMPVSAATLAPFAASQRPHHPGLRPRCHRRLFDVRGPAQVRLCAQTHFDAVLHRAGNTPTITASSFTTGPTAGFATTTIVGTRAGGAIAGAWALFQHLGRDGYTAIADQLLTGIEQLRAGVADIPGLTVLGRPELSIVAIGADGLDIFRVAEHMRDKGWVPGLLQEPKALHRMMSMLHVASMPAYLDDLKAATEATRSERSDASELRAEY